MLKIYTSDVFQRHETGFAHPERAARLDAALEGVERAGLTSSLVRNADAHPDAGRIIARVHAPDYERRFEEAGRPG